MIKFSYLYETCLKYKDSKILYFKEEKIYARQKQKKCDTTILISDKIDKKAKK